MARAGPREGGWTHERSPLDVALHGLVPAQAAARRRRAGRNRASSSVAALGPMSALTADPAAKAWKGIAGVVAERDKQGNLVPGHRTEIRSRWTEKNLYLLFICPYEELNLKPEPFHERRHQQALGMGRGGGVRRHRLREHQAVQGIPGLAARGVGRPRHRSRRAAGRLRPALELRVRGEGPARPRSGASGTARCAFPSRPSIPAPPQAGREMRINLYRIQGPPANRKWINWQPVNRESFHTPEAFGRLRLEN